MVFIQLSNFSKRFEAGHVCYGLLLSVALPVLLVLAFLTQQIIHFDHIGLSHGFSHPLIGWDHLVTMLAVGVWAAQLRGHAIWLLPLAFVAVMSLGGLAGAAGIAIPSVEGIILLSCAVFGVLITRKIRFSGKINVVIVAFFAFFHGFAHGQEISTSASLISYTLGFMLATLLLHGAGILVAKLVVLVVSCLLAAMFSGAALAKHATGSFQDDKVLSRSLSAISDTGGSLGYADSYLESFRAVTGSDSVEIRQLDFLVTADKSDFADFVYFSSRISNGKLKTTFDYSAVKLKKIAANASMAWQTPLWVSENDSHLGDSGFKQQFPDINHTPGTHLLSNGVGLNSPPSAKNVVYPRSAVHFFRNTIHQGIEDHTLHMAYANFDVGKPLNITISKYNRFDRIHSLAMALPVQHSDAFQSSRLKWLLPNDHALQPASAIYPKPTPSAASLFDSNKSTIAYRLSAQMQDLMQIEIDQFFSISSNTHQAHSILPFTNN